MVDRQQSLWAERQLSDQELKLQKMIKRQLPQPSLKKNFS